MRRTVTCYAFILFLLLPSLMFGQSKTLQGTVKSGSTGLPLAGVTVQGGATNNAGTTDSGGNFSIAVDKGTTITFSYVGYETRQVVVNGDTAHLIVELAPS